MRRSTFVGAFGLAIVCASSSARADDACVPACRSGYVCKAGECVSACNPACAQNETCTAQGECAPKLAMPSQPEESHGSGWAVGAGVLGIVSAVVITGGTVATIVTNGQHDVPTAIGAATTGVLLVTAPIVAVGAASARSATARGSLPLRVTGWIAYGLTIINAGVLIGYALTNQNGAPVPNPLIAALGGLGLVSLGSFTADAFVSAAQADRAPPPRPIARGIAFAPVISATPGGGWVGALAAF